MTMCVSREQACRYLLYRQGLLGAYRFRGAEGLLDYVRMVGCVQFDPVDVCGKSHELALLARVKDFSREMLASLLYERRALIDYFDKNMCIMLTEDWSCLEFMRAYYRQSSRGKAEVDAVAPEIMRRLHEMGCASSQELGIKDRVDWYWSATTLSRAALETLYFRGDLVVHHKTGTVKSYALASDCLPASLLDAPCPFRTDAERQQWQLLRRVGAIGMLWNAPSDAWLGIDSFKADARNAAFAALESKGELIPVTVEGLKRPLYLKPEDMPLLENAAKPFIGAKRARFLAPLDCILWDRKLILALFDFDYKWEIYTPAEQRKYAHYTLPVLYGEHFAGRVEPICDRKAGVLRMRRFWQEKGFRVTNAFMDAMRAYTERLCAFHGLERVTWGANDADEPCAEFVVE